jgi:transcriptional regulator with XRE-family HTH domain
MNTINKCIRFYREKANVSIGEVAKQLNISEEEYYNLENNGLISYLTGKKIAEIIGVDYRQTVSTLKYNLLRLIHEKKK